MNFWWCNQNYSWDCERRAGVVCSSDQTNNVTYRKTVAQVRAGDIIIHYHSPNVIAISRARDNAEYHKALPLISGVGYGSGWRLRTDYFDLPLPIFRKKFVGSLVPLIVKHYPVNRSGKICQGYLFPFDLKGTRIILSHLDKPMPAWLSNLATERSQQTRKQKRLSDPREAGVLERQNRTGR